MSFEKLATGYVEWTRRRSDFTRRILFLVTVFFFVGIVVPLLDVATTIEQTMNGTKDGGKTTEQEQ